MTAPARPRLLIHGASGRMGEALLRLAADDDQLHVIAAVTGRTPAPRVIGGVAYFAASELTGVPDFDVAIDFSLPAGFDRILALCVERNAGFVSGTTGLEARQQAALTTACAHIPLIWASNFSLGVAVLNELVERAAACLPGWDCDIVESHHRHKQDTPSGTALTLGEAAAQGGTRPRYSSLRAGDIVGEHLVQFTGFGERLELTHRAGHRDIFARGALHIAKQLVGRTPGRYRIGDMLSPRPPL